MKKVVKEAEAVVKTVAEVKKAAETKEAPKTEKKPTVKAVAKAAENTEEKAETTEKDIKKTVAKKAPAKKAAVKEAVYLQYLGKEINKDDIMKQVKEIWTKQLKNKVADLESVTLYLKPEENMAYYVINNDVTGSIEL